jgi:hypothetical protein
MKIGLSDGLRSSRNSMMYLFVSRSLLAWVPALGQQSFWDCRILSVVDLDVVGRPWLQALWIK